MITIDNLFPSGISKNLYYTPERSFERVKAAVLDLNNLARVTIIGTSYRHLESTSLRFVAEPLSPNDVSCYFLSIKIPA